MATAAAVLERLSGINKFCQEQGALVGHQQEQCGSLGEDVSSGIFPGHLLGTPDGIEKSRSMTRKPLDQRWKPEGLAEITATPWSEREVRAPRVRFQQPAEDPGPLIETAAPAAPRALRINKSDLITHGFAEGCPQCDCTQRYGKARPGGTHTAACRERLTEAIRDHSLRGSERSRTTRSAPTEPSPSASNISTELKIA